MRTMIGLEQVARLVEGRQENPFELLGPHVVADGQRQALAIRAFLPEARTARGLGYHAVLLSLAAWKGAAEDEILAHCEAVAAEMPLAGFYLQPAVGGLPLPASFWRRFARIENAVAIKIDAHPAVVVG